MISFPLTAGQHTIELRYTAPGLVPGAIVSGVSLVVFVCLLLLRRRKYTLLPPPEKERCLPPVEDDAPARRSSLPDVTDTYDADFFEEFADLLRGLDDGALLENAAEESADEPPLPPDTQE